MQNFVIFPLHVSVGIPPTFQHISKHTKIKNNIRRYSWIICTAVYKRGKEKGAAAADADDGESKVKLLIF